MPHDWLENWATNHIPFHLDKTNPLLEKHWPKLGLTKKANVLVPLCGKTKDLLWLANQDLLVTGVELSHIAGEAFFVENQLEFNTQIISGFTRYYNEQIEIFCGDFFDLSKDILPTITAVYDRAALIALPDTLRQRYAQHLTQLTTFDSQILLITLDSADEVQGPPYPVSYAEVGQLFNQEFQIIQLESFYEPDLPQRLFDKGYRKIQNVVYKLKRVG